MTAKKKTVTIELDWPIDLDAEGNVIPDDDEITEIADTVTSLTFRRMKTKDTLATEGIVSETRSGYAIFASMCGQSIEVFEELDADDLQKVVEKVTPLMGKQAVAEMAKQKAKQSAAAT